MSTFRLYRPLYQPMIDSVSSIFNQGFYADKVIERLFKENKKWGSRDRHTVAFSIYGIVRWWRRLLICVGSDLNAGEYSPETIERVVDLWVAINQPDFRPDFLLTHSKKVDASLKKWHNPSSFCEEHSLPDWLKNQINAEAPEKDTKEFWSSLNKEACLFVRTNTLKVDRDSLQKQFKENQWNVESHSDWRPESLRFQKRVNVFTSEEFKKGFFEVQDGGSQKIAPFLEPQPGERIVDACAGAGGKTLHLASLMKNKGRIIAMDVHQWKLNELKKRARRASVHIVETKLIDSTKVIKRLQGKVDGLLLDVPCTGLGVLKRNPDTKWKLKPERLEELVRLQKDILSRYSKMVKPGGRLVYATCSVLPSENEKQVEGFLKENSAWSKEAEQMIDPHKSDFDGFYMCRLRLKN